MPNGSRRTTPPLTVEVVAHRVLDGPASRTARDLDHWIDGSFGAVERHGEVLVISPNGRRFAVHRAGRARDGASPFGELVSARTQLGDADPALAHASGGPALYDRRTDTIFVVYHGELHRGADPTSYYSMLGLASSSDGGRTFVDLGTVLRSSIDVEGWRRIGGSVELGPGSFVVHDGWLTLFFQDKSNRHRTNLGAARGRLGELVTAAREGRPWALRKYHGGTFTEPADGGLADELFPIRSLSHRIEWFDVARHVERRLHVLVYSAVDRGCWNYHVAVSRDGLSWSLPVPLFEAGSSSETLYVTIWSRDPGRQRVITDDEFDLVIVRSETGGFDRWRDAQVELVTVRLRTGG